MATVKRKNSKAPRKRPNGMTGTLRVRIDPALKLRAEKILARLGISPGDAIRVFYKQITLHNGLPYDGLIPNEETQAAMAEFNNGGAGLSRYSSSAEMLKDVLGE